MSRRTWTTEDGWDVAIGFDQMLGHYFFDIVRECEHDDDEDLTGQDCDICRGSGRQALYDNLDDKTSNVDPMGGIHDIKYLEHLLTTYLTEWPPNMLAIVYADQDTNFPGGQYYGVIGKTKVQPGAEVS